MHDELCNAQLSQLSLYPIRDHGIRFSPQQQLISLESPTLFPGIHSRSCLMIIAISKGYRSFIPSPHGQNL
jgi:hypothetical protein